MQARTLKAAVTAHSFSQIIPQIKHSQTTIISSTPNFDNRIANHSTLHFTFFHHVFHYNCPSLGLS